MAAFTILAVCSAAAILALAAILRNRKTALLPPGPRGHWLWGTTAPLSRSYLQYAEWCKEYGPVYSFRQGTTIFVIICSYQAAMEIMNKESSKLADRPRSISAGETMSGGKRVLLMGAGERERKIRRALHGHLQSTVSASYKPIQTRDAKNLVLDILKSPQDHILHAKCFAASVILSVTYGKQNPTKFSDPEVQEVNHCLSRLGQAMRPGTYLVDSVPILRYVPGYLSSLKQYHREELALFRRQVDAVRVEMKEPNAPSSFAGDLISKQAKYQFNDDELAYVAGSMFGAGADTTASTISFAVMAAARYPHLQRKIQSEMDHVVGRQKLPTFEDHDALLELQAFILEVLRWRPVSASGVPHRATEDVHWRGYIIPAGATVIGNHWCIGRDEEIFSDPDAFDPQRWITATGTIRDDLRSYFFGFGRRICPGLHLANNSVFISLALLFWAFDISQSPSAPIDTMALADSANVRPLPFEAIFQPRIEKLDSILTSEAE